MANQPATSGSLLQCFAPKDFIKRHASTTVAVELPILGRGPKQDFQRVRRIIENWSGYKSQNDCHVAFHEMRTMATAALRDLHSIANQPEERAAAMGARENASSLQAHRLCYSRWKRKMSSMTAWFKHFVEC